MTTPVSRQGARGASLEQLVDVETPEQVVFSYAVAGVGSRAAAAFIDYAICLVAFIVIVLALGVGFELTRGIGLGGEPWMLALLFLAQFVILWGYYVLFEGLADGQTPGKRIMRLRVVQDGGFAVSFSASAVRNLLRILA